MSHAVYDTLPPLSSQLQTLIEGDWEQEVLSQLPADAQHHARELGAFVRPRELKCVGDLLRGLLAYVLCAASLRHLGAWSVLIGLANLSHVAWQKRLRAARGWLLWLLIHRLSVPATCPHAGAIRIILVDATRLKEPGGSGDDWRLHLAYDLLAGQFVEVKVSDRHTAEGFRLFDWRAGDIVVADRGYSRRKELALVFRAGAHVVVRLAPQKVPLLDRQGQPFDVLSWLKEHGSGQHSCQVAFQDEHGTFRGRLVACALPEEAAQRARAKECKRANKQQRAVREDTLFLCGWLLILSSLPESLWSDEQILALYRARWQIELLIKRMKQVLKLAQLRGKTALTNEATILALLVAWSLLQPEVRYAREVLTQLAEQWTQAQTLTEGEEPAPLSSVPVVSSWTTTSLEVQTFRMMVQGFWTLARLRDCLPWLARFLCSRRQGRSHQESDIRRLLMAHPALSGSGPSLLFYCSSA
jgi:Transposase DDE domain